MNTIEKDFFKVRDNITPCIYAYSDSSAGYEGLLKIGYTIRTPEERVKEQYGIKRPIKSYKILFEEEAIKEDGSSFNDKLVHKKLREMGIENPDGEWFKCDLDTLKNVIISIKQNKDFEINRTESFKMRPEQEEAVNKTYEYFTKSFKDNPDKVVHFLWNAKMRFGKTFTTYQLAKKMSWKKILILTFKPVVQASWEEDLKHHIDFEGWQFICNKGKKEDECLLDVQHLDKEKPIVCFGSFQDFLGKGKNGSIKVKNEWVHTTNWDCVVLDEYHYGAWRDKSKEMFENTNLDDLEGYKEYQEAIKNTGQDFFNEDYMPITTKSYLYLSGTPFRAINSGEFIEEQIFNWTYSDEQKAKEEFIGDPNDNPYLSLPKIIMMTYQLPHEIEKIALMGEFNEFSLNEFFSTKKEDDKVRFKYENEVQKWLNFIRGSDKNIIISDLKLNHQIGKLPFNDSILLNNLTHTLWFLPNVDSCHAMKELLKSKSNTFYHDYEIIDVSGEEGGNGVKALDKVRKAIGINPLNTKTITLTCGRLTTGVSVKEWSGIFMLRNLSTPETYFQSAFRIQTPWTIKGEDNKNIILKEFCYIFDFAPNRALKQLSDYSSKLNPSIDIPLERKVAAFISFLPILAYENGILHEIEAKDILDKIASGTTATLLARRWESALLVNVDNNTLQKLMDNKTAMDALMNIEDFRNLNRDIETIINKSNSIKSMKKEASERELTEKEKKVLSQEEKEYKSLRKKIQDKLIKFATRIPIFMYLTDHREETLRDIITKLEPTLFKKVTGLDVKDFELLLSLNVFNSVLMNDAIAKFKRYEDSSLGYSGINLHSEDKNIGLFDTTISKEDFKKLI